MTTCGVFGTLDAPSEHPTGTFHVLPGHDTIPAAATNDSNKESADQRGCPVLGPGFVLGPVARKLRRVVADLGLTEMASGAVWVLRLGMPLTHFQAAVCPLLERVYLLAGEYPIYYVMMSIVGEIGCVCRPHSPCQSMQQNRFLPLCLKARVSLATASCGPCQSICATEQCHAMHCATGSEVQAVKRTNCMPYVIHAVC
jgi:hypothetical protein